MPGVAVRARDFGWQHAGREAPALSGVNFEIAAGEKVLLAGPSGAGKSTLLAGLAGVLGGDDEGTQRGEILLREGAGEPEAPGRRIPVGLVLQDPDAQITAARVGDDAAFGCENLGVPRSEIWPRVRRALDIVGLDVPLGHRTEHLSGGQKQRLALAGVIAMGAGLILLDEPTANLDPRGAREVVRAVGRAVESTGATLVVVEHNVGVWEDLLGRALVLSARGIAESTAGQVARERRQALENAVADLKPSAPAPSPRTNALYSRELRCAFGPPRTFAIPEGQSTVITGANGSGKSTWLLTMGGLLAPADRTGSIGMSERVARGLRPNPHGWSSKQLAQRIGFVFQNPEHQFVGRTVEEELRVAPRVMGVDMPEERIEMLAGRLRLRALVDANPFTLSGGEKRRLSVATALVASPAVVLLDEPTFGQDPETFAELIFLLRELVADGVTIASITHDELFIRALGDHRIDFGGGEALGDAA